VAILICIFVIKERKIDENMESPPLVPAIMQTLRNKPFMGLLPAWV